MGMTDPIADLLTRIRNGGMASKPYVDAPYSKMKAEIVKILKQEGYVNGCTQTDDRTLQNLFEVYGGGEECDHGN